MAEALNNPSVILDDMARYEEALAATTEAVRMYRPLAEQNPGRYSAECAHALMVSAQVRLAAGEALEEGRRAAGEAVARYDSLAATLPEAYDPHRVQARSVLHRLNRGAPHGTP